MVFHFALLFFYIKSSIAEVTFLDVIENPSDLKINLTYAKEQEALGRYKATLATLERLNMLYPVNTDIKLYLISIFLKVRITGDPHFKTLLNPKNPKQHKP